MYFKIKNVGNSNVYIENIISDCQCTVGTWDAKPIAPNEVYKLSVKYEGGSILGYFEQKIAVYFKNGKSPSLLLLEGKII